MPPKCDRSKGRHRGSGAGAGAGAGAASSSSTAAASDESAAAASSSLAAKVARVRLTMDEISSCVGSYWELCRMQAVCVAWRDGVRRASVALYEWPIGVHGRHLASFRRSFPHAAAVNVNLCGAADDNMTALRGMVSLRRLQFPFVTAEFGSIDCLRDGSMAGLLACDRALTALTALDLGTCPRLTEATAKRLAALPCLMELILPSSCLGHGGCDSIARMGGLRSLRLSTEHACKRESADGPACEVPEGSTGAWCVCRVGPSAAGIVAMAAGLTSLTELKLWNGELVSGTALSAIAAMPALTSLTLQNVRGPDEGGDDPPSLQCLRGATGLTKLDLMYCRDWVTDRDMAGLLGGDGALTALTSLDLKWGVCMSEATAALLAALPCLMELDVCSSCLGHGGCDSIARMGGLRSLRLAALYACGREAATGSACEVPEGSTGARCVCQVGPSAAGIVAMAAGLTSLTELQLGRFCHVSGAALSAIAAMSALTSLKLQSVGGLRGAGDTPLRLDCLRGATGLTQLDLSGCNTWVQDGVMTALRGLTGLAELNLQGCSHVTDAGMASLAGYLPWLRLLNLRRTRIEVATLDALAERTSLTELHVQPHRPNFAISEDEWQAARGRLKAARGPALRLQWFR